jgi:Cullin family/Cullin protein neddylation domain
MTRCDLYGFDRSTRAGLTHHFDRLIVQGSHRFLTDEESVLKLLEKGDANSLNHVYSLLQRVQKGTNLGPIFEQFIREEGCRIVFDEEREVEMVTRLLEFKKKLDHFHKFSFHDNEAIGNGLHKSFEYFINKTKKTQANWDTDNAKPGEMIAKHVDLLLKGGVKAVPKLTPAAKNTPGAIEDEYDDEKGADEDTEINHHLSLALDLFRFVHGKAVFEAFYKKDLARRLLMGRSASNDAERNMLGRLKTECGAGFTHNLESMFKDMDLARDEMISYNQLQNDRGTKGAGPDLNVNVLSSAAWPSYPDVSVTIPTAISKLISNFESYYQQKHSGRKLHWKHALAHCQLKAYYPKGIRKEIVVSGFQAIVLLLFNDLSENATLSYNDIRSATSLPDAELQRTLQSLACAKYRVLTKHPKGRDVNPTDTFSYNAHFTDPKTRIKINQIQLKETKEENKETHIRVAADRHYETQAAIVRIMKSRKTIGHAELVAEVIKATRSRGVLEPSEIKKNIDK